MSRWDAKDKDDGILPYSGDPWSTRWAVWGKGLDQTLKEIRQIDKESGRLRMNYIRKHDDNRGFDNIEDLV
jgi:hypothetical protein